MPTDRGLVIIGFEIIAWSCVKRNEKRETVASTADSWLPGVLLIAGYQGMRLTCFLLVAVHTAGQPRAM